MNDADPAATSEQPTPPPAVSRPDPAGRPTSGPRVSRDEMKDLGRLRRSVTDRHIAGVAGGIARHLDIDAIIVRVALVVGVFFGGAGLLLYVGAWLLVPEEGTDDEPLGLDQRSRSMALAGVGILALLAAVGDWAGAFWFPWPIAIVAAIVVWFLHRKERNASRPRTGYGYTEPTYAEPPYAEPTYAEPATPRRRTRRPPTPRRGHPTYAREPRRPRNPRKRGPKLFLFTLALIALAEGVLGVVDLAGCPVADSAYPALALGITAVDAARRLLLGPGRRPDRAGPRRRHRDRRRHGRQPLRRRGPLLRPDQCRRRAGAVRLRRRASSPSTSPASPTSTPSTVATSPSTASADGSR